MAAPLKVLFCTDGIFPHAVGGMQRHSRLLIEALADTGAVELTVLHPHSEERVFPNHPAVKEIVLEPLPGKRHYFLELYTYSKQVLEQARKHPNHLIYAQGLSVWAGLNEVATRCIVNPHGLEPYQVLDWKDKFKTWPYRLAFDWIFRRAAKTVALGGRLTDILKRRSRDPERIVVLPNATNPLSLAAEQLHKQKEEPFRFLFTGRFAFNKGIEVLLKATQKLNEGGYAGRFEVGLAGKGPLFEEMVAQYPLPNVNFLGFVSDEQLAQAYLDCRVFVLPTLFEGMPTVVLEAMARATPIVVTDVGATRELVDERNGLIVTKQDVDDLVRCMAAFIDMDETTYANLSKNSLQMFLERFTWKAVAEQHVELFAQMNAFG